MVMGDRDAGQALAEHQDVREQRMLAMLPFPNLLDNQHWRCYQCSATRQLARVWVVVVVGGGA